MSAQKSVAFHTLGCKLNYSETSSIGRLFEQAGYFVVPFDQGADIYVINTCSVTDFADRKCRSIARKAKRLSPQSKVIMMGCYAQLKPEEIAEITEVDLVLGASEKFDILSYVEQLDVGHNIQPIHVGPIQEAKTFREAFSFGDRTRTFLKVQDGCDYNCSFCTIPLARGRSRSIPISEIVRQAETVVERGAQEIVLTGVNIGDYGKMLGHETQKFRRQTQFIDLVQALDKVNGLKRIRISSIEPNLLSNSIIEHVAKSEKWVPHFHIPLQSGNDEILTAMRRRYRTDLYRQRIEYIHSILPEACIGVDVIVGFPGESDDKFQQTYRFLQELPIAYLHVFTYSERENTPAYFMPDSIPMHIRRERNKMLSILSDKKKRLFYHQFEGTTRSVLFEPSKKPGMMTGFTDNYLKVTVPLESQLLHTIHPFHLTTLDQDAMLFHGYPVEHLDGVQAV